MFQRECSNENVPTRMFQRECSNENVPTRKLANLPGACKKEALRVSFDRRGRLEPHGSQATSETGLSAYRKKDKNQGLPIALALLSTIVNLLSITSMQAQSTPFGPPIQATATLTVTNGFIVAANLVNGGSGYPVPPTVSVVDPSGSNAVIVAAISSSGVVTNLTIDDAGTNYSAGAALVIAPAPTNTSDTDINVIISPLAVC
jgi:hypothetical protein